MPAHVSPATEFPRTKRFFRDKNCLGHGDEFPVPFGSQLLQPPKRGVFVNLALAHEQALCTLDRFAVPQCLPQILGFLSDSLKLSETANSDGHRRLEVRLLDWFDEIRHDAIVLDAVDGRRVGVRRDENDRHGTFAADLLRGLDPIQFGHFDVRDYQVGRRVPAVLDQLPTVFRHTEHVVAESRQDAFEILLHIGLVVRHGNA